MEAKPYACDTRQGLRVRGCGIRWMVLPDCQEVIKLACSRTVCEWPTVVGDSPVGVMRGSSVAGVPSSTGLVESRVNLPGPPGKPEYSLVTDSGLVP
jgi:hypothetical protein